MVVFKFTQILLALRTCLVQIIKSVWSECVNLCKQVIDKPYSGYGCFQEMDGKVSDASSESSTGRVEVISLGPSEMEIDFIGYDISLVNAYRRIILAEVSSCAAL